MVGEQKLSGGGPAAAMGLLAWWWRRSGPPEPPPTAGFDEREQFARGRLVSSALLCYFAVDLLLFPLALHLPLVLWSELIVFIGNCAAIWLNRDGRVETAGAALVASADAALVVGMQGGAGHLLDIYLLPGLDLFIIPTLIAAVALAPRRVFPVAAVNSALVAGLILVQPHTHALQQLMAVQWYLVVSRPICLQIIVASIAYLWVRGMLRAVRRADLAEEVAALRQREVERNRELADGVRQLLDTHAQVANGQLHVRAPIIRGSLLFPLSAGLNTLISRLDTAESRRRRAERQAHALCQALEAWNRGERVEWPAPSGTAIDAVSAALRNMYAACPATPPDSALGAGMSSVTRPLRRTAPLIGLSRDFSWADSTLPPLEERGTRDGQLPAHLSSTGQPKGM